MVPNDQLTAAPDAHQLAPELQLRAGRMNRYLLTAVGVSLVHAPRAPPIRTSAHHRCRRRRRLVEERRGWAMHSGGKSGGGGARKWWPRRARRRAELQERGGRGRCWRRGRHGGSGEAHLPVIFRALVRRGHLGKRHTRWKGFRPPRTSSSWRSRPTSWTFCSCETGARCAPTAIAPAPHSARAVALTIADGYGIDAGVALSADGKTMVLLATRGKALRLLPGLPAARTFPTRRDDSAFTGINQRALQTMQHYAAPVLAPDGTKLRLRRLHPRAEPAVSRAASRGIPVVYESVWTTGGWAMPESISQNLFDGTTAARALPSALSSDSRTLFYETKPAASNWRAFAIARTRPCIPSVGLDQRHGRRAERQMRPSVLFERRRHPVR